VTVATDVREALRRCLAGNLTFVAFRAPPGPIRVWVQDDPVPISVQVTALGEASQGFVIAPFFSLEGHAQLIRPDVELVFASTSSTQDVSRLDACTGSEQWTFAVPSSLDKDGYKQAIAEAKKTFGTGELKKVVLARTVEIALDPDRLADLFLSANATYPEAFIALVHTSLHGTWIGASPERLVLVERGRVSIDALAGTMAADHAPTDAQQWGAKERGEQELVTLAIVRKLEQLGSRNIVATGPMVKKAGQLAHLHTAITADVGGTLPGALASALHPTPAVCGEPMDEALQFIREQEPQPRALYTGFWGPCGVGGRAEFFVNIRCMQVFEDRALLHVGAGITSGSDPEREWEETEWKAGTWMQLIGALPTSRIS